MNYTVEIHSPVHIGTGKNLTPFDFALSEQAFIVVNLESLVGSDDQLAQKLNDELSRKREKFSLTTFLKTYRPHVLGVSSEQQIPVSGPFAALGKLKTEESKPIPDFRRYYKYTAALDKSVRQNLLKELERGKNMDVREIIKTEPGWEVYLPGSSLKGAFRTALAYFTFKNNPDLYRQLTQKLHTVDFRRSDEVVNELIFWGAKRDPKYDLFKILRFSDSKTCSADACVEIGQMKILSLVNGGREPLKPWWTFFETLKPGVTFTGTVHIENYFLEKNAIDTLGWRANQRSFNLDRLIQSANHLALDACIWELRFFGEAVKNLNTASIIKFYQNLKRSIQNADSRTCYLCIGQGAGWHKMTVGMLLENDPEFDFKNLRKRLRLADKRLEFEYPKSRKVLMEDEREVKGVLGWVKIRFEEL